MHDFRRRVATESAIQEMQSDQSPSDMLKKQVSSPEGQQLRDISVAVHGTLNPYSGVQVGSPEARHSEVDAAVGRASVGGPGAEGMRPYPSSSPTLTPKHPPNTSSPHTFKTSRK